jgi:hypothetical protein
MRHSDSAHAALALVVQRFPERAAFARRLVLRDQAFRGLCEDYALAQASLAGFEARPDAAERPEIADYHTIIAELEGEIARFVRAADPGNDGAGEHR